MASTQDYVEALRASLKETEKLRARNRELTAAVSEPVAIVSMACRYPGGVASPDDLWRLVERAADAIAPFPEQRGWSADGLGADAAASDLAAQGGFLDGAERFDAAFFGISPREALAMDPQQRLLLESGWEAFERAGIAPDTVRGSRTGVFVGATSSGYGVGAADADQGYVLAGGATSVLSGRVAYVFGLEGPAVTVDTACSSSLVALHLAVQALRAGECTLALAGGVTVLTNAEVFHAFSAQQGLASDGRCRSFGAGADGTGWGEGVGLLLLERLSDARRNGHQVLAVVRGSAVNQDGASNGMTAPNGPAQRRVIRQALATARLAPSEVDVVEAHGTGTKLGDPIEAQALLATYGQERPEDRPLWLGSIKSNIGHTQSAAGVAGIIKMVQAMRHGLLPATLHAEQPTSHVDWSAGAVELLTEARPWPEADRPRRAGVSSFGISGTNAHVILEQGDPLPAPQTGGAPGATLWPVSAKTPDGLRGQAQRLRDHLATGPDLAAAGHALAVTRAGLEHRAVVLGDSAAVLGEGLAALAAGEPGAGVVTGAVAEGRTAFLFTGQGAQRAGMGRDLYEAFPAFAAAFDAVCAELDPLLDRPLKDVVFGGAEDLDRTVWAQAGLFAVEVASFRLLESWGVVPDVLLGHSIGEVAAAHVAGVFPLADACALVAARGRLMQALPSGGAMLAVQAGEAEVRAAIGDRLDIAAVNGPTSVVVSGPAEVVEEFAAEWAAQGRRTRRLTVSHAFHSALMEPMLDGFAAALADVTFAEPRVPLVSDLTGEIAGPGLLTTPDYWVRQVREAVRFADGVEALGRRGVTRYAELGPDGVLCGMVRQAGVEGTFAPVLRGPGHDGVRTFHAAVGALWTAGAAVDWSAVHPGRGEGHVALPTYAFQHQSYWAGPAAAPVAGTAGAESAAESGFWSAVEREDVAELTGALGVAADPGELRAVLPALSSFRRRSQDEAVIDSWRYRVRWKPLTDAPAAGTLTGTWLVVSTPGDTDAQRLLTAAGAEVVPVELGPGDTRAELAARLRELAIAPAGVVACPARHPEPVPATVALIQALGDAGLDAALWLATRGGVSTGRSDGPSDPAAAQLWGLGRAAALELPERWGGLVDLPPAEDARTAARLAAVLTGTEDQVAVRSAGTYVRRLVRAARPDGPEPLGPPPGTVLVTGGTGALGAEVARWLSRRGTPHLVLTSRRGSAAEGVDALVAELTGLGTRVTVAACDAADRAALAAVLDAIPAELPLTGVVHAAGIGQATPLMDTAVEEIAAVLGGKADGAAHLDELTAGLPLELFVVFSSISATWGSGAQAVYGAANAYLEALVEQRRAAGRPALAVAWGPWAEAGMAVQGESEDFLRRRGLALLDPALAVQALDRAVGGGEACVAVADVHWERFAPAFTASRRRPLIEDLPEVVRALEAPATAPAEGVSPLAGRLAALPPVEQERILLDLVRRLAAAVLGHREAGDVPPETPFKGLGFDSLTALELRNALVAETGLRLSATLVFDHPTPRELAAQLRGELLGTAAAAETVPSAAGAVDEPIAIVAMSCRYPGGVESPEQLWQLVADRVDAVSALPDDRGWPPLPAPSGEAGTDATWAGGFLSGVADFDPALFAISPREALAMDPQQRLLLETVWEAFERAGVDARALRGSRTGVFIGTNGQDYAALLSGQSDSEGHRGTGTAAAVLSGRISYVFGLEGPAMTVDTACSSSLVALHSAAEALRRGECTMALAGGATVMATPSAFVEFSRQLGLAADGRCKAFAAGADGTGWGEGVGILLLERLSDARRNGHRVLGVVRGSAVNQDGASNGLTAPNGPAQERVIRQALANAGLSVAEVDAVEAHGTGTRLGDPIEAKALLATYGQDRSGEPLWLGSIKSNIGHTQAAAGIAGIIKMVMAMRNGTLPATLHVDGPTPHVDWSTGAVELLTEARPWPRAERPRRTGVSSFGMSGTNAHVIIEEGEPAPAAPAERPHGPVPWPLSGQSPEALRAQAARLGDHLTARPEDGRTEVARALSGRTALAHRAVVVGADRAEQARELAALAAGEPGAGVVAGTAVEGRTAFLFTGQGAQRVGMGRDLYEAFPAFAAAFDAVCAELDLYLDRPVRDVVFEGAEDLDRTVWAQAGLFAVEVASFRLLESWGVAPDFLLGHSIGEVAAAHVAGVFSLADACALVAARGRLMEALPEGGAMLAAEAGEDEVREAIGERLDVAAVNGPTSVVVSGPTEVVEEFAARWQAEGRRMRRLTVSHAFHSALMEPMLAEFSSVLEKLTFAEPRLPLLSNVTGTIAEPGLLTEPDYWVRHVRAAVRFADDVAWLGEHGVTRFLELGPDGVLCGLAQQSLPDAVLAPLQRAGRDQVDALWHGLGRIWTAGAPVDWAAALPAGPRAELPTYAFQRACYWPRPVAGAGDVAALGQAPAGHPLLGAVLALAGDEGAVLTGRLSTASHPWLADHAVLGRTVVPGTALVELALRAGEQVGRTVLDELVVRSPLTLPERGEVQVQVRVAAPGDDGDCRLEIHARADNGDRTPWTCHATGLLTGTEQASPAEHFELTAWPPPAAEPVPLDGFYDTLADGGYGYGPAFRGLRAVWRAEDAVYAEVALPEQAAQDAAGFALHPALLDAALHAVGFAGGSEVEGTALPFAWTGVRVDAVGASVLRARITRAADGVALRLADGTGSPVATVRSLVMREVSPEALGASADTGPDALFAVDWRPVPPAAGAAEPDRAAWAVVGETAPEGGPVRRHGDLAGLVAALDEGAAVPPVTVLAVSDRAADAQGAEAVHEVTARVLGEVRAWLAEERFADSRLVVLTRGATEAGSGSAGEASLAGAAVWGLVRSAQTENPDRIVLVDLEPQGGAADPWAGWPALMGGEEPQLAVRGGDIRVPRLVREASVARLAPPEPAGAWRLGLAGRGTGLEDVALVAAPDADAPLGAGEVRVAVRSAGVNFRDVLIGLGMYPDRTAVMGSEASGVVLEVGSGVTDLAPGERVFGFFAGGAAVRAVTDRRLLARVPQGWSFAQAASVPLVFATAYYGLRDLADAKRGESVLVHAAAGGVGMAAVQLARHFGLEVYGTASPGKWRTLRELGLDEAHIASSRDLAFEERFRAATGGRGVDLVLNSLAGGFTDASLRLLAEGGRFLEMGKTDVRQPAGLWYRAFDLGEAGPARMGGILHEVIELFEAGALRMLPITAWDVRDAIGAFRHVSQARHVGKNVLTLPVEPDPEGTVLITGGTGTLGGLLARHLAAGHGVRHLTLLSRRGAQGPGVPELLAELAASGAQAEVVACDAADRTALARLLEGLTRPLTGVVHAAGVLDDGVFGALTPERLSGVLRPKVDAALNLHELTAHLDLSMFVLYSSVSGTFGSGGQANYAAANAFLDALAARRTASGQAGQSLAWGLWEQASGLTGHLGKVDQARAGSLSAPLSTARALALFDRARTVGRSHLVPVDIDLGVLRAAAHPVPALLRALVGGPVRRAADNRRPDGPALAERLAAMAEAQRDAALLDLVTGNAAVVLGHGSTDAVAADRPFKDLGFDSLTSVELRNRLNTATGLRLPPTLVFDHPTPAALARHLRESLLPEADPVEDLLSRLAGMEADLVALAGAERAGARARLEQLLDRLRDADVPSAEQDDSDLESATAEDIFALIDDELGS
ncbi:type I polyketide synthase [Kitasatospora sp. NPDC005856]|uniref:type I polyketide synthase n=1 Tax=Kitasatospora sp. NPDC005856 TaxID=3154566 RepID=UPI0033E7E7EA